MVYTFNKKAYKVRYGGDYWKFREEKLKNRNLSLEELKNYQKERYKRLIDFAITNSKFYKKSLGGIKEANNINYITSLPILNKETLRKNISRGVIKTDEKLEISKIGGTTGKSLEVQNFARNSQERFAFFDDFRSRFAYELGKKTAWFSGKALLTNLDIKRTDFGKQTLYTVHVIILLFTSREIICNIMLKI